MDNKKSVLVISLDFELYWGMTDKVTLKEYGERILGVRKAIPAILELFKKYNIHATWATLGLLMHETKDSLLAALPPEDKRPVYAKKELSSYEYLKTADIKEDEEHDPYHFGVSLLRTIQSEPNQEIASHTFSHYYCIDGEDNPEEVFDADCKAFNETAKGFGVAPRSIVFPRNQANTSALRIAKANGIRAYRGNEEHFLYRPRSDEDQSYLIRGLRLLDHYINISGHHTYNIKDTFASPVRNIRASRFLRPYNKTLGFLEPLRLKRIEKSMTHAAKHGEVFHIWWHPHNFGVDLKVNLENLESVLMHYKKLCDTFGMKSSTIAELTERA